MTITIIDVKTIDIRFPTSRSLDGSDAMNVDPDYSAAYVILHTDSPGGLEGHGLTFTIGRGNDLCCRAIEMIGSRLIGRTLTSLISGSHTLWELVTGDSQYRWLGPEKGIIHLATAAVVNAVWDLFAKAENKPLWKLLVDLPSEEIVAAVPFRYITDALKPAEAFEILKRHKATRAEREAELRDKGFPAYTTSAGWLGYTDGRIRELVREAIAAGWSEFKMKVGRNLEDDLRRAALIREEIGWDRTLMLDANQVWDVPQAIEWMKELARFKPLWIEEPTSPDDVMGHAAIARAIAPIGVASGEHCQNRVMFKQFLAAGALSFCQIDSCRLGGVNEVLAVLLLAAKFDVPVCPHAGGVGLCEYVQHLSAFDYIAVSGSLKGRRIEFVDHLHEHFIDPVVIRNGHYRLPIAPGYSITMKPASLEQYAYPNGDAWRVDKVQ